MCRPSEYPPYDKPIPPIRLYSATYYIDPTAGAGHLTTITVRLWATDPDDVRRRLRGSDPSFIATVETPRIIR